MHCRPAQLLLNVGHAASGGGGIEEEKKMTGFPCSDRAALASKRSAAAPLSARYYPLLAECVTRVKQPSGFIKKLEAVSFAALPPPASHLGKEVRLLGRLLLDTVAAAHGSRTATPLAAALDRRLRSTVLEKARQKSFTTSCVVGSLHLAVAGWSFFLFRGGNTGDYSNSI